MIKAHFNSTTPPLLYLALNLTNVEKKTERIYRRVIGWFMPLNKSNLIAAFRLVFSERPSSPFSQPMADDIYLVQMETKVWLYFIILLETPITQLSLVV